VTPEDRSRLVELLTRQRLLALAVVVDAEPVVGLMPYAYDRERAALYVQASRLARHSQGLKAGGAWSGVIHEPDTPQADPLQVPRLVLDGHVEPLRGDQADFAAAARTFVSRFPGAAMTLALPDFGLYRLALEGGRLILGFGAALNLSRSHFEDLAKS
jgi:uncharacterized protein YhbP (UPF0306 family)